MRPVGARSACLWTLGPAVLGLAASLAGQSGSGTRPGDTVAAARRALTTVDETAIRSVLDSDGLFVTADGRVLGRADYAAHLRRWNEAQRAESESERAELALPGGVVIATNQSLRSNAKDEAPASRRVTELWLSGDRGPRALLIQETVSTPAPVPGAVLPAPGSPGGTTAPRRGAETGPGSDAPPPGALELDAAWTRLATAVARHDAEAYASVTEPGLLLVLPDGSVQPREQRVRELEGRRGQPPGPVAELTDSRVRVRGDIGVLVYLVQGRPLRMGTVWVRRQGAWRQAAAHVTPATAVN